MFWSRWRICKKLLFGLGLLLAAVGTLSWNGLQGLYDYQRLLANLGRVGELSLVTELNQCIGDLRVAALTRSPELGGVASEQHPTVWSHSLARIEFEQRLDAFRTSLLHYRQRLDQGQGATRIGNGAGERDTLAQIEESLDKIAQLNASASPLDTADEDLNDELRDLQNLVDKLPSFLHEGINRFPEEVRDSYRQRLALAWTTSAGVVISLLLLFGALYLWVFRPLRVLIKGSRKVEKGNFDHRIVLNTHDEMAELAAAMNDMTARFQEIRDDLDRRVQERTRESIRTQQLASVGFLAAGVAHEINDPVAEIARAAASLEARTAPSAGEGEARREAMLNDVRQIHDAAFRCKEITSSLLDFSRKGDASRVSADLVELAEMTIDMIGHWAQYQEKHVLLERPDQPVRAVVNVQEIKQVLLNLIMNGLDNVERGGTVAVTLQRRPGAVEIVVRDDGAGMLAEELRQVFHPCFSRRGNEHCMGFGLSVAERIVLDHGGRIDADSQPGEGSQFIVRLPNAGDASDSVPTPDHRRSERFPGQPAGTASASPAAA